MRSVRFKERAPDKFAERLRMSARRARGRSIKLFVVFKYATNRLFVSRGELDIPLLPFGLSSPVSEKASLLLKCGTCFPPLKKVCVSHKHNRAANSTY